MQVQESVQRMLSLRINLKLLFVLYVFEGKSRSTRKSCLTERCTCIVSIHAIDIKLFNRFVYVYVMVMLVVVIIVVIASNNSNNMVMPVVVIIVVPSNC